MRILFMGRKAPAAAALTWTLEQGYEVVGVLTDHHLVGSVTASVARRHGLRVLGYEEAADMIANGKLTFDLGVSFVYWRILKNPFLTHPSLGIINFHPAPLPEYKGTAGYNLAILEDLDKWGVTAHYVDAGIDTGGIIDIFEFSIDSAEETAQSLEAASMEFLLSLYKKTVRRVTRERILPTTPNEGGRYVRRSEMEAMKLVKPGDDIDRKIRAFWFPPYSGATIEINGKSYTLINDAILRSLVGEGVTHLQKPRSST